MIRLGHSGARLAATALAPLVAALLFGPAFAAGAHAAEVAGPDSLPSDSTLSLAWVERTAISRNPSLSAMREAWREADARAEQAGALEDPMLEGMVAPQSLGSGSVDPAYRIGLTQQFPIFGQRGLRRRAAGGEAEVAAYDFEAARLDLLRDVREGYFDYYRVSRGQEANRELMDLMGESRTIALAKYAAGTVGQTDPLQAETELAMLEHEGVKLGGAAPPAAGHPVARAATRPALRRGARHRRVAERAGDAQVAGARRRGCQRQRPSGGPHACTSGAVARARGRRRLRPILE